MEHEQTQMQSYHIAEKSTESNLDRELIEIFYRFMKKM